MAVQLDCGDDKPTRRRRHVIINGLAAFAGRRVLMDSATLAGGLLLAESLAFWDKVNQKFAAKIRFSLRASTYFILNLARPQTTLRRRARHNKEAIFRSAR